MTCEFTACDQRLSILSGGMTARNISLKFAHLRWDQKASSKSGVTWLTNKLNWKPYKPSQNGRGQIAGKNKRQHAFFLCRENSVSGLSHSTASYVSFVVQFCCTSPGHLCGIPSLACTLAQLSCLRSSAFFPQTICSASNGTGKPGYRFFLRKLSCNFLRVHASKRSMRSHKTSARADIKPHCSQLEYPSGFPLYRSEKRQKCDLELNKSDVRNVPACE